MSSKEFTLQKGFILPILKALTCLNKKCTLKEINQYLVSGNLFSPREGDEEKIDFNDKIRFEGAVEHCLSRLIQNGLIIMSNDLFEISQSGTQKLSEEWMNYNQNNYIKSVDSNNNSKYVYYNIPPYLLFGGHRQLTMLGFGKYEHQFVKLLNDFIDYIDLNYPTMEEMVNFLKYNYDFTENEQCLNAVNIIRSSGLSKVMGRNLSLTKLGQWYINSYSFIALFKIFTGRYVGLEEIFNVISLGTITIDSLKDTLANKYNFDWVNSDQFEIRLNWMEDLEIIKIDDSNVSLSGDALGLAEYLGLIDLDNQKTPQKVVIPSISEVKDETEFIEDIVDDIIDDDFNFSYELDEIVDDLISDAIANEITNQNDTVDSEFIDEAISEIKIEKQSKIIKKPLFNLVNENPNESSQTDSIFNFDEPMSSIIHIPTKISYVESETDIVDIEQDDEEDIKVKLEDQVNVEMYIKPEEISGLVNIPKDIVNKIASALNMGKHIILTGAHGSGKTSIAVVLAKIAHQKALNNGYNLASANEYWTGADTIGSLIEIESENKKTFKEGVILKSIRENRWLIIDEIGKCDTYRCFNDFINALHGYNTTLSYMHKNYKNIEVLSETNSNQQNEVNQYFKSKDWRIIATLDTTEKNHLSFSPAFIRRFAFIDIGANDYSKLIDEYFIRSGFQNDLLKTKVKSIFGQNGLSKYKDIGASSLYDLIQYLSIRTKLIDDDESIYDILAEGLELYILPQLRILDEKVIKDVQEYLLSVFEGNEDIKQFLSTAL